MSNYIPKRVFKRKWRQKEIMLLLERLHMYIAAGLSLDKALLTTADCFSPKQNYQKRAVFNIFADVKAGESLSKSIKKNTGLSEALSGLIAHGETSGELAKALGSANSLMERQLELKDKVMSAMTYPVVIGLFAVGLTIGLMRGVMPQITPMLKSLHVSLPLVTIAVMWSSEWLTMYGLFVAAGLAFFLVVVRFLYRKTIFVKSIIQYLVLITPLIGPLVENYSLTIFLHSFGSLVESGVPASRAYSDTVNTVAFRPLFSILIGKVLLISRGSAIGPLLKIPALPPHVSSLISAGEESGTLGASIIRAAEILDRDIEHSLKRLTSLIEPVMMAGMGVAVGAIAIAIMMPIYNISRVLQK